MSDQSNQQISGLLVPAGTIQHFAEIDLGLLDEFPRKREDLVALSIRMDMAFTSLCQAVAELIRREHEEISREVLDAVFSDLALDFIERYGTLALFCTGVLEVLWEAQRPKCQTGPKRLRQVGHKLAVFAMAWKGSRPKKTIDITFKLFKPDFLTELDRLSRELGASESDAPWADQLLESLKTGDYPMLKQNLRLLEEFLRCPQINPDLNEKNALAAELLAQYGIGKQLGEKRSPSMTPDMFFYTFIAWATNKRRSTVRREIQTAASRWWARVNKLIRVTKNR